MAFALLLVRQNLLMLCYLIVGWFLFCKKLVGSQGSADLGRLLLYAVLPMSILKSYLTGFTLEKCKALGISALLALLALGLAILLSRVLFSAENDIERFGTAFSNAGFIGIPLVQMTLGEEAVFYAASFVTFLNILQWTYGVVTLSGDKTAVSIQKLKKNPIILSFALGLVCFFFSVQLPGLAVTFVGALASMNGPLAMIVLGTYLAQTELKKLFVNPQNYMAAFVRLVVIPAATALVFWPFAGHFRTICLTVLIVASAPIGSNVPIFAQLYQKDYTKAVQQVCLSTLAGILTIPVILALASVLYG